MVECDVNERGVHAKKRLDTSDGRSLGERLWRQRGFLESVEAADTSGSPPFGRSLASLTQHPKWAGEIAINCFQIRSLARSSQRVVSGKCLRHESNPQVTAPEPRPRLITRLSPGTSPCSRTWQREDRA